MTAHWSIGTACDAINEGCRVIGAKLRTILAVKAPEVQLNIEQMRTGDSMEHAFNDFRKAVRWLDSPEVPDSHSSIFPWYLGPLGPIRADQSEYDIDVLLNHAADRADWSPDNWTRVQTDFEDQRQWWMDWLNKLQQPGSDSDNTNDVRDKWIYEQCVAGTPYKNIILSINKVPEWSEIESTNGIKGAANRYALRHGLPPIPVRTPGRPMTLFGQRQVD